MTTMKRRQRTPRPTVSTKSSSFISVDRSTHEVEETALQVKDKTARQMTDNVARGEIVTAR